MAKTMAGEPDYKHLGPYLDEYTHPGYRTLQEDTAQVRLHQRVWNSEARTLKCYGYCSIIIFIVCTVLLVTMATIGIVMSLEEAEKIHDVRNQTVLVRTDGITIERWNLTTASPK